MTNILNLKDYAILSTKESEHAAPEDGTKYIRLGCYFRTLDEWEKDFWNNPREFPNNGDVPSKQRWMAYQTCLNWFAMTEEEK